MVQRIRRIAALVLLVLLAPAAFAQSTPSAPSTEARAQATTRVDINTAAVDELESLPGIGPALASRIIAHRQENGPFRSVDDLLAVKGIGPKMLEKLRDRITASPQGGARK